MEIKNRREGCHGLEKFLGLIGLSKMRMISGCVKTSVTDIQTHSIGKEKTKNTTEAKEVKQRCSSKHLAKFTHALDKTTSCSSYYVARLSWRRRKEEEVIRGSFARKKSEDEFSTLEELQAKYDVSRFSPGILNVAKRECLMLFKLWNELWYKGERANNCKRLSRIASCSKLSVILHNLDEQVYANLTDEEVIADLIEKLQDSCFRGNKKILSITEQLSLLYIV